MKGRLVRLFNNLPIARKLLLTALIPLAAFLVLGIQTYLSLKSNWIACTSRNVRRQNICA
jgi:hypothetical protein